MSGSWTTAGRALLLSCALGALLIAAAPAQADVTVNTEADELAPNSQCSLREAITAVDNQASFDGCTWTSTNPNTINLPPGDYAESLTSANSGCPSTFEDANLCGDFDIAHDTTIVGAAPGATEVAGAGIDRVFDVLSGTVTISGATITGGQAPTAGGVSPDGGGVRNAGTLTLTNDAVTANAAGNGSGAADGGNGGGIASSGFLSLNTSSVDHNHAGNSGDATHDGGNGGGIAATAGGLFVAYSTVADNNAGNAGATSGVGGSGGGTFSTTPGGTLVTQSTIAGNVAGTGHGGGNSGGDGGGVLADAVSSLLMQNDTVANNSAGQGADGAAGGDGGGIWTGIPTGLTTATVAGNGAGSGSPDGVGGGIRVNAGTTSSHESIFASSARGGNCSAAGTINDQGFNIGFGDATCPSTFGAGDPGLGPLQNNGGPTQTMEISGTGAAVDQVPGNICPFIDQRNVYRPEGPLCDIGAFELIRYGLAVAKGGSGSGTVTSSPNGINCGPTCNEQVDEGKQVTLTATPDSGSNFAGWSGGGCSGTGPCTVTMNAAATVTAKFAQNPSVSVAKGGTGLGKVTSSPAGISCGATCDAQFDPGTSVTLTPKPHPGSKFGGWSGGGCSGTGPCTFTIDSDTSVTARFAAKTRPNTDITKAKIDQHAKSATFRFKALGGGGQTKASGKPKSSFQCLFKRPHRKAKFKDCTSPRRYKNLKRGKRYTFEVRAVNSVGKDQTPAIKKFKIN